MAIRISQLSTLSATSCLLVWLSACVAAAPPEQQLTRLPNPAVAKCIADGWQTEPVLNQGVPSGTICIDPKSAQRCEAWAYFRGECPVVANSTKHDNVME